MPQKSPTLRNLSEILTFFRESPTSFFFLSPTPYNLLGIERFVRGFQHVNYFDSFDGAHPRVMPLRKREHRDFESMEEVSNYLLSHGDVVQRIRAEDDARLLFVMFDEETEALAADCGAPIALPPDSLRRRLDSKIETTRLGNAAGIASVPNTLTTARSYEDLLVAARESALGEDLVVQTAYGDSGRTTFFITSSADWERCAKELDGEEIKVMKRIDHMPGTLEACVTRHGTLVGPVMTDITGFKEITPYAGGWCGNDIQRDLFPDPVRRKIREMARAFGDRLAKEGYRGVFCMDFLVDQEDGTPYLGEINPRISGASPLTNLITATYGGVPLFLFHLLEFLDVDYEIDLHKVERRWRDFDSWSQLVLKQTEDEVRWLGRAPATGIWRLGADGGVEFSRPQLGWSYVLDENEAFFLRVYGAGNYTYKGAELGILMARASMQTELRALKERALQWNAGMKEHYETFPIPSPQREADRGLLTTKRI